MPSREVIHGDALEFLRRGPLPPDHAIITSLPDHSEVPALGVDGWKQWFVETVALACSVIAPGALAVFYQTDVKHDGRWIDKGHLVMRGMDDAGTHLLWHKIVCRVAPAMTTFGRPAYTHMLAASREHRLAPGQATPDVLPALGTMTWARAMGTAACEVAVRAVAAAGAKVVVDPFCGQGSVLAAANAAGLDAIGVELSRRRAARARGARE